MALTIVAGQMIRASTFNALVPVFGIVTSDQTVTNSQTLVNATNLVINGLANQVWEVQLDLMYQAPAANDFRPAFTWPAGSTFPWGQVTYDISSAMQAATFDNTVTSGSATTYGGLGANTQLARIRGLWTIGATAGALQFQFAQWISGAATSAVVKAGTVIRGTRVS